MHHNRKILILLMFVTGWLMVTLLRAPVQADDPPPAGEVFTDAPDRQEPSVAIETSCEYSTVFFNSTTQQSLDGLVLMAAANDIWTTLAPGQTALRYDGWMTTLEGKIMNGDKVVADLPWTNVTECVTATS